MSTRNRTFLTLAVVAMACLALTTSANAALLLKSDFSAATSDALTPGTFSGITYTGTGLTGPSFLKEAYSLEQLAPAGVFAPNTAIANVGNIDFSLGLTSDVEVTSVIVDSRTLNASGGANAAKIYGLTATLTGGSAGVVWTALLATTGPATTTESTTFTLGTPVTLDTGDTWILSVSPSPPYTGGTFYFGLDGVEVNGSVVPEPATLALLGLGGLGMLMGRRRHRV